MLTKEPISPALKRRKADYLVLHDLLTSYSWDSIKAQASVDWIEIIANQAKPTSFTYVRKKTGSSFVTPLDDQPGGTSTRFKMRFQNPQSWQEIRNRLAAAGLNYLQASIAGIEISMDYRILNFNEISEDDHRKFLSELSAYLILAKTGSISDYVRFYKGKGTSKEMSGLSDAVSRFESSYMFGIGRGSYDRKNNLGPDDEAIRQYVKDSDRLQGQSRRDLPRQDWSAREEQILHGQAVPFSSLASAGSFRFTQFSKRWKYRKFRDRLTPAQLDREMTYVHAGVPFGARKAIRTPTRGIKHYRRAGVANADLNSMVYEALRRLDRQMNA